MTLSLKYNKFLKFFSSGTRVFLRKKAFWRTCVLVAVWLLSCSFYPAFVRVIVFVHSVYIVFSIFTVFGRSERILLKYNQEHIHLDLINIMLVLSKVSRRIAIRVYTILQKPEATNVHGPYRPT